MVIGSWKDAAVSFQVRETDDQAKKLLIQLIVEDLSWRSSYVEKCNW